MTAAFVPDQQGVDIRPSPNFGPRRDAKTPSILLLHYTGMETGQAAEDWLCNAESGVSCHYIVHEDGRCVQMVREEDRAWHAGDSFWKGETDINSSSIGIEIVNRGHDGAMPAYPDQQIDAVIALSGAIAARHAMAPENVLAHSDVAPGRKADPGEIFPWDRLHAAGVGHFVEPAPLSGGRFLAKGDTGQPVEAYQSMLALYGYRTPVDALFGEPTHDATVAFQRHFRPARVDGVADISTIETLHRLLSGLQSLT